MSNLRVQDLSVRFGSVEVLERVSLELAGGEVAAVLGPSGSGKTTLLRSIAGLIRSEGSVWLGGRSIGDLPTHERGLGLMFQDHALFPHLDVAHNVAFGVRELGWSAADVSDRVEELLDLVELAGFEHRRVDELSGGEAQRVALARALAPRPALLMLDEPLGALDRRLRDELAAELQQLLRVTGTTALYVTHDQDEAAIIADRLLIFESGRLVADGSPATLWLRPPDAAVARFLGHRNVTDSILIPATAVDIEPTTASSPRDGEVERCRFVDGAFQITVALGEPIEGLGWLWVRSGSGIEPGSKVTVRPNPELVHRFSPPM